MLDRVRFDSGWRGRRVLVTGHTGFKGGWLTLWLQRLGAEVIGFSLPPSASPSLFETARVAEGVTSLFGDIRDRDLLTQEVAKHRPEVVFHLAAQSLVRLSYREPVETYETNVLGTLNVLEAVRQCGGVKAVVVVTSDKCYENREWVWGYRETDPMGGHDPYSSSKGCAELLTAGYRSSFFAPSRFAEHGTALASGRAGNVIGGGDWAEDRLVPDIFRAFVEQRPVTVRNPAATRPWQHVFEPLRGYMVLAQRLLEKGAVFSQGWNFGPQDADVRTVGEVVDRMVSLWPGGRAQFPPPSASALHEAQLLKLDCAKARALLGWEPMWGLQRGLEATVEWYRGYAAGADMRELSLAQLDAYQSLLVEPA